MYFFVLYISINIPLLTFHLISTNVYSHRFIQAHFNTTLHKVIYTQLEIYEKNRKKITVRKAFGSLSFKMDIGQTNWKAANCVLCKVGLGLQSGHSLLMH